MAQSSLKTFQELEEIYPTYSACERERKRWQRVIQTFKQRHGHQPSHIVRAPGRVNVLGEHIDYSLFPVIPAAIEQDILIAVSTEEASTPSVHISNTCSKYTERGFDLVAEEDQWVVGEDLGKDWVSYAKASIAEVISRSSEKPVSMRWLVDGVVPEGAGLSSSAAFTVSAVISALVANGRTWGITQSDIVRLALKSEHRLGLVNGGMDQAASVFCLPGQLLHLSFHPELSPAILPLPSSLALVITNSLEPHALAESAPERYNLRVFENLCAVRLLLHAWHVDGKEVPHSKEEAERTWMKEAAIFLGEKTQLSEEETYHRLLRDIDNVLGADGKAESGWTREEIIDGSGLSAEAFDEIFCRNLNVRAERFHLYKRAKHTIEESLRVVDFKKLCETTAAGDAKPETLQTYGKLINASHESLRDLYDCTVDSVDRLQELCLECGALGSRQTGGGWGGAVVSLVPVESVNEFLVKVKQRYPAYQGLDEDALNQAAFATAPGCGAGALQISDDFLRSLGA